MRTENLVWLMILPLVTRHSWSLTVRRRLGKYTTKEIVERAPLGDHPCQLTRTAVKVSFPDMQDELFVNLIGYKEPNLVHLARCRGQCAKEGDCQATRVRQKSVKMLFMTQLTNRDPNERVKELILDEHLECGCLCKESDQRRCQGLFNQTSCLCSCDAGHGEDRRRECERSVEHYWDRGTCQCRRHNVVNRRDGTRFAKCSDYRIERSFLTTSRMRNILILAICILLTLIMLTTTLHYRRKYKYKQAQNKKMHNRTTMVIENKNDKTRKKKKRKRKLTVPKIDQDVIEELLGKNEYEVYGEQEYDQHGVRIDHQYIA